MSNDYGQIGEALVLGLLIFGVLSIFGVWKIVEIIIWLVPHIQIVWK